MSLIFSSASSLFFLILLHVPPVPPATFCLSCRANLVGRYVEIRGEPARREYLARILSAVTSSPYQAYSTAILIIQHEPNVSSNKFFYEYNCFILCTFN
jgi:hypothetical protein